MTTHMNNAKLGLLLPAILNPAVAAALGIGIVAVGLYRLLPDDGEDATVEGLPSDGSKVAVPIAKQSVPTVELNEVQRVYVPSIEPLQTADAAIEPDQSEMIRKAMSELGKRSAAARAKKKIDKLEME